MQAGQAAASARTDARAGLPSVVIIGGGFGGLYAALGLRKARARVTVVDRHNYHLFQPLLYQVASAALNPSDIAAPIREVLRRQRNTEVILAEAVAIDRARKRVVLSDGELGYDKLIIATGATHSYFGHDEWERFAPGLKTIEDALEIRRRVLLAFEAAEREPDEALRRAWLTFVIVGGGPTGVELAGAFAEIARHALKGEFRHIDPSMARVLLVEGVDRVLPTFTPGLSASATRQLARLGVEVLTSARVTGIDSEGVRLVAARPPAEPPGGAPAVPERLAAHTVIWAAGVAASPLARSLGVPLDRAGRVRVRADLTLAVDGAQGNGAAKAAPDGAGKAAPDGAGDGAGKLDGAGMSSDADVMVIGDLAALEQDGKPIPGVAPAAIQGGKHAARNVLRALDGKPLLPFRYLDKGSLATIGRSAGVADLRGLRLSGFFAWAAWALIHIVYLIGFRNRLLVVIEWGWAYLSFRRGARLITGPTETLWRKPAARRKPEAPRLEAPPP